MGRIEAGLEWVVQQVSARFPEIAGDLNLTYGKRPPMRLTPNGIARRWAAPQRRESAN